MRFALVALTAAAFGTGCAREKPAQPEAAPALPVSEVISRQTLAPFSVLPVNLATAASPLTRARVDLGRRLYYETLLSGNHNVSCNSCHPLNAYGVDGRRFSMGDEGQLGGRNAPSVYNAAGHVAQFWDGRAADVEEQAKGPILNPAEMGMPSPAEAVRHLGRDPSYVRMFQAAFPGQANPVNYDNVGRAIGAFERGLVTPSRWDAFLSGNTNILTSEERIGLNMFVDAGCVACHNGPYLGARFYHRLGVVEPWANQLDRGREAVTKRAEDAMVFKVASLRNVSMTAPYFHDGSVPQLGDAVRLMGEHQLGRELSRSEISAIVAYLETLTGRLPTDYIAYPAPPN